MLASRLFIKNKSISRTVLNCYKYQSVNGVLNLRAQQQICSYHNSAINCAKGKKETKASTVDVPVIPLPDLKSADNHMDRVLSWLTGELAKVPVGRLGAETFGEIRVPSVGTVSSAGQLTMKGPTKLTIAVYDPSLVKAVAEAIRESGFGVNPTIEGNNLTINIPKPSKEARDLMQKSLSKLMEKSKLDVRRVRGDVMDSLKKCKGSQADDVIKRHTKDIETITDKKITKIEQMFKEKEKEFA